MSRANKYLNVLGEVVNSVEDYHSTIYKKLSEIDKKISEHYHRMENANFNACEGFYFARDLQDLLRKRRIVKDELAKIHSIKDSLNSSIQENQLQNHIKSHQVCNETGNVHIPSRKFYIKRR